MMVEKEMKDRRRVGGFTLIELMIVVVVLGIIAAMAAPAFNDIMENRRMVGAAEQIRAELHNIRSESIKQSADMFIRVARDDTNPLRWVLVSAGTGALLANRIANAQGCDPWVGAADPDACLVTVTDENGIETGLLRQVTGDSFRGVNISLDVGDENNESEALIRFDRVRGTAVRADGTLPAGGGIDWTWRINVTRATEPTARLEVRINPMGKAWICQPGGSGRYRECQEVGI